MAALLEASSDSDDDFMMEQDSRATRSKLQDVGYREGKDELLDANVNAQASFEKGMSSGYGMAERAGRVRGMMVALVAMSTQQTAATTATTKHPTTSTDNATSTSNNNQRLVEQMKQLVEQIQLLPNPTLISDDLMATCEAVLLEQGFVVVWFQLAISAISAISVTYQLAVQKETRIQHTVQLLCTQRDVLHAIASPPFLYLQFNALRS